MSLFFVLMFLLMKPSTLFAFFVHLSMCVDQHKFVVKLTPKYFDEVADSKMWPLSL